MTPTNYCDSRSRIFGTATENSEIVAVTAPSTMGIRNMYPSYGWATISWINAPPPHLVSPLRHPQLHHLPPRNHGTRPWTHNKLINRLLCINRHTTITLTQPNTTITTEGITAAAGAAGAIPAVEADTNPPSPPSQKYYGFWVTKYPLSTTPTPMESTLPPHHHLRGDSCTHREGRKVYN